MVYKINKLMCIYFIFRCVIRAHHWPDCNRGVEAVFVELCALYPNAVRSEKKRVFYFTMMVRVYRHIRKCVISNAKLMTETTIQHPEVNAATVYTSSLV